MKKTKLISIILAFLLVFSMLPLAVSAEPVALASEPTDSGVEISDAKDFLAIANDPNGIYYLANDIDFSSETITTPYLVENFSGVLDGRGFSIYGFELKQTADATADVNMGVFGTIGNSAGNKNTATVYNLTIGKANAPVKATVGTDADAVSVANLNFGFLAGTTPKATSNKWTSADVLVEDVQIYGSFEANVESADEKALSIGGFCGELATPASFSKCTFNGSISLNDGTALAARNIGGIAGFIGHPDYGSYTMYFGECVNNASITVTGNASEVISGVAGILGVANTHVSLIECINNGAIETEDAMTAGILGVAIRSEEDVLTLIYACASVKGDKMYGYNASGVQRICIMKCTEGFGDEAEASAQNLPDYTPEIATDKGKYGYVMPITDKAQLALIGNDATYGYRGFYRLDASLDVGGCNEAGVVGDFGGVFDGNGKTVHVDFNSSSGGFFTKTAAGGSTAVLYLQVGSNDDPVTVKGAKSTNYGLLGGAPGTSAYDTTVYSCDVYGEAKYSGLSNHYFGGFFANAVNATVVNSNFYGSIDVSGTQNAANIGGFVGDPGTSNPLKMHFLNCNNYADISAAPADPANNRYVILGGIVGYANRHGLTIHNCSNFGNMSRYILTGDPSNHGSHVGGLAGYTYEASVTRSSNFGSISGRECAAAVGTTHNAELRLVGFQDFGTVTPQNPGDSRYVSKVSTVKYSNVNTSGPVVSMDKGASIRLDSVNGIRFTSNISASAIEVLEDLYGEGSVSYGTIITCTGFIGGQGATDFTLDALDEFAESLQGEGGFADTKTYVKIDATDGWFKNTEGKIAGSLINIGSDMYDVEFSARAYVSITVDGVEDAIIIYSDYNATDHSRSIKGVAEAAYADVSGGYTEGQIAKLKAILGIQ